MSELPQSVLGRTGLAVSRLGYGSMELRHTDTPERPHLDRAAAGQLLNHALDEGITYFDTSPTYGPAEELIGEFLSGRRAEFTLATKTGFVIDELPGRRHEFTTDIVRKGLEWSLKRLKTDHVDLVQLPGNPAPSTLVALDTLAELEAMRDEGKCRFIGISGWLPSLAEHLEWGAFDVYQIPYSALERDNEPLISDAARAGIGTVIRGGVAQGATVADEQRLAELTGGGHERAERQRTAWRAAGLDELLGEVAPGEFMVRYLMSNPAVTTAIIGTTDRAHLDANLAAASRGPLPAELYETCQARLTAS